MTEACSLSDYKRLPMKVQPICSRNPSILEMSGPWDNHQEQQLLWSGGGLCYDTGYGVLDGSAEPWSGVVGLPSSTGFLTQWGFGFTVS